MRARVLGLALALVVCSASAPVEAASSGRWFRVEIVGGPIAPGSQAVPLLMFSERRLQLAPHVLAFDLQRWVGTRWAYVPGRPVVVNRPPPKRITARAYPVMGPDRSMVYPLALDGLRPGRYRVIAGVRSKVAQPTSSAEFTVARDAKSVPMLAWSNVWHAGPATLSEEGATFAIDATCREPLPWRIVARIHHDWSVEPFDVALEPATFPSGACGVSVPPLAPGMYVVGSTDAATGAPFVVRADGQRVGEHPLAG